MDEDRLRAPARPAPSRRAHEPRSAHGEGGRPARRPHPRVPSLHGALRRDPADVTPRARRARPSRRGSRRQGASPEAPLASMPPARGHIGRSQVSGAANERQQRWAWERGGAWSLLLRRAMRSVLCMSGNLGWLALSSTVYRFDRRSDLSDCCSASVLARRLSAHAPSATSFALVARWQRRMLRRWTA